MERTTLRKNGEKSTWAGTVLSYVCITEGPLRDCTEAGTGKIFRPVRPKWVICHSAVRSWEASRQRWQCGPLSPHALFPSFIPHSISAMPSSTDNMDINDHIDIVIDILRSYWVSPTLSDRDLIASIVALDVRHLCVLLLRFRYFLISVADFFWADFFIGSGQFRTGERSHPSRSEHAAPLPAFWFR